ncbi:MAG: hypothetical protein QOJ65_929, partial [Fimbriimonadaceae bacterium]|nr:hypothetical protein [Fimbriimonadaceae bacterium]
MIERVLDSSPPKAVTFLMSDVEGSTRMWERLPTPMRAAMARLDQIVESTVSGCNGQLLKQRGEGDSHFAVFGKASEAAETSVEIQKALAAEDWGELGHLRIRIAISTGEADHRDGDYYGPGVNRCARMRGAAHGGQILISHAVQQAIKDSLPFGCSVMNLGEHRFRDLLEPERVYQLLADGLPRDFPALKSIDASRNNLPVQLTSFIGREKEVSQLHTLLKKSRLVTLTGAGGCGKTRLGLQVAADFVNELDDGVWFVELVGLTDGRLISQTIAEAMHLSLTGDNPLESLLAELKDLSCMLVLDNCEHLVRDAAAVAARVLKECRRVKLFATSRERLAVTGEQVFLVPPLDCDLRGQDATLEHVAGLDSVKLLRERAASRTSDQILTEDSAAAVAQLCKRLDGIPLAIEQAASNLPYLSPAQILDRLEQHLSILATDEDDIDPRHRTLQATIDWSYEMLSAAEKLL